MAVQAEDKVVRGDDLIYITALYKAYFQAKEAGKGLSSNDYTTTEKNKLAGIAEGAQVNFVKSVDPAISNGVSLSIDADGKLSISLSLQTLFASPAFTGTPTAPTASAGASSTQVANTAFVAAAITAAITAALGTLDTTATVAQSPLASESFGGNIVLHKVAKTGTYSDLIGTPSIPSAPGSLDTTATTAQTASANEALSGSVVLHKVSKTGTYSDLIGKPNLSLKEDNANKVTSLSSSSTDVQYPSAKCVYDMIGDIETLLAAL